MTSSFASTTVVLCLLMLFSDVSGDPSTEDVQACIDKGGDLSDFDEIYAGGVSSAELDKQCGRAMSVVNCLTNIGANPELYEYYNYICASEDSQTDYLAGQQCFVENAVKIIDNVTACTHATLPPEDFKDCIYYRDTGYCFYTIMADLCGSATANFAPHYNEQHAAQNGVFGCNLLVIVKPDMVA